MILIYNTNTINLEDTEFTDKYPVVMLLIRIQLIQCEYNLSRIYTLRRPKVFFFYRGLIKNAWKSKKFNTVECKNCKLYREIAVLIHAAHSLITSLPPNVLF
uniref:Uncharacterized protein n=1 Tax=Opuntia streptacantha TaxID=393608 RepID=A0A7C8YBQ0_OPUST